MARPLINHHMSDARERVYERLKELRINIFVHPDGARAYTIGRHILVHMEPEESSVGFLHDVMRDYWECSEAEEQWDAETIKGSLRKAMKDVWRAKEAAEKEAKKERAAKVIKIAEALHITKRQARNLLLEGTRDQERAGHLASITGQDASDFLRQDYRKRNADLVRTFMNIEHPEVTFKRFIADDSDDAEPRVRDFINSNTDRFRGLAGDFDSLEAMIEGLRRLGFPADLGLEEAVWRAYKVWRITTLSAIARFDVEDA